MEMTDTGWQPIETAPRDGTRVLLMWMKEAVCGEYRKGRWELVVGGHERSLILTPTHWLPIPRSPWREGE